MTTSTSPASAQTTNSSGTGVSLNKPSGRRTVANNLSAVYMILATVLAIIPLVWVLATVLIQGLPLILDVGWWTQDQRFTTPLRQGGGAIHAIVGSLIIGLITAVISIPIAILGAIFLVEYARGTKLAKVVSFSVDILSGVPSIVAALFIYAVLITTLGLNRSAVAASLALVILMLPVVLRSTEEMLKLVPDSLREAGLALGTPKWKVVLRIVIPTAFGGIATGVVLGMARVLGETAPLLILVALGKTLIFDPMSPIMATLPTMINDGRAQPDTAGGYMRAWGAALTLIIIVMGLNIIARAIGAAQARKQSR